MAVIFSLVNDQRRVTAWREEKSGSAASGAAREARLGRRGSWNGMHGMHGWMYAWHVCMDVCMDACMCVRPSPEEEGLMAATGVVDQAESQRHVGHLYRLGLG